jgi:hypothetical protein
MELTKTILDLIMRYETYVVTSAVGGGVDRQDLERVMDEKFNSADEVRKTLDPNNEEDICVYSMCEFADACNDSDDDSEEGSAIDLYSTWIGYVKIKVK